MAKKTWKELEAEGVHRCCAMFSNRRTGKSRQCRRRAVQNPDGTWQSFCAEHGPMIQSAVDFYSKAAEESLTSEDKDEDE
jgi:hypothetical protein